MKNRLFVIFTLISMVMAAASYLATDNYFMLGGVFVTYLALSRSEEHTSELQSQ